MSSLKGDKENWVKLVEALTPRANPFSFPSTGFDIDFTSVYFQNMSKRYQFYSKIGHKYLLGYIFHYLLNCFKVYLRYSLNLIMTQASHTVILSTAVRGGKKAYYDLVFAKINCLAVRSWPLPSANGEEVLPHNLMHCPKPQCHRKLRLQSRFSLNLIFALSTVQPSGMLGLHQPVLLLFQDVYERSYDIISAASLARKQEKDWWPK